MSQFDELMISLPVSWQWNYIHHLQLWLYIVPIENFTKLWLPPFPFSSFIPTHVIIQRHPDISFQYENSYCSLSYHGLRLSLAHCFCSLLWRILYSTLDKSTSFSCFFRGECWRELSYFDTALFSEYQPHVVDSAPMHCSSKHVQHDKKR